VVISLQRTAEPRIIGVRHPAPSYLPKKFPCASRFLRDESHAARSNPKQTPAKHRFCMSRVAQSEPSPQPIAETTGVVVIVVDGWENSEFGVEPQPAVAAPRRRAGRTLGRPAVSHHHRSHRQPMRHSWKRIGSLGRRGYKPDRTLF
jgi:hypothetical protein